MPMLSSHSSKFATAVCEALGLKHVKQLTLEFQVDEAVQVTAVTYADNGLDEVVQKFRLSAEPIEEKGKGGA